MLIRTRGSDGVVISPGWHMPPVQINTPYVPHPLQLAGQIPLHGAPGMQLAPAGKALPSLKALAASTMKIPFSFNGFLPR